MALSVSGSRGIHQEGLRVLWLLNLVEKSQHFVKILPLGPDTGNKDTPHVSCPIDQKRRRPCEVPPIDAEALVNAIVPRDLSIGIDEDCYGDRVLGDMASNGVGGLAHNDDEPSFLLFESVVDSGDFPKAFSAIGTPRSSNKLDHHRATQ